jgi:hypothetical protein
LVDALALWTKRVGADRRRQSYGERGDHPRTGQHSGVTPGPTVEDETANNCDEYPADGIQRDHAGQQEC